MCAQLKTRISDDTVQQIIIMIRGGRYAPGDRLPGERRLAEQLKVSRASVREALRRLETIGMLESRQGTGTFVTNPSSETVQSALVPAILTDQATLEKLFELREIIEVEASARAARRATAEQIERLQHWVDVLDTYIARHDQNGITMADIEFHRQIIVATGNDILVDLMGKANGLLLEMRYDGNSIPELIEEMVYGHRAILKAISDQDSQSARQAMQDHLNKVRVKVKAFWAARNTSTPSSSGDQP